MKWIDKELMKDALIMSGYEPTALDNLPEEDKQRFIDGLKREINQGLDEWILFGRFGGI